MQSNPVINAVTHIAASPEEVWSVLSDLAGYDRWHPSLRFVDVPTAILPGTKLQAWVKPATEIDGESKDGNYEFTVLDSEVQRLIAWEGGIPDVLTGRHSFALEPYDGGTRFTETEVFTGAAAVETVEPNRSQMEQAYESYGRALKARVEEKR